MTVWPLEFVVVNNTALPVPDELALVIAAPAAVVVTLVADVLDAMEALDREAAADETDA